MKEKKGVCECCFQPFSKKIAWYFKFPSFCDECKNKKENREALRIEMKRGNWFRTFKINK